MAEIDLTQAEADALIAIPKVRIDETVWSFPVLGGSINVPLISTDHKEHFLLDVSRSHIDLSRAKYQTRGRQVVVLARLDLGGQPHRNPDDAEIGCPHLHLYREGFGDRWAFKVPEEQFAHLHDLYQTLFDFMGYCNVTLPPSMQKGLF
jgi:hypothetical protein